jgi:multidrug transporter EmrE-like cation transporter
MPTPPPGIGQPTRRAGTGRENRGQRGNKWWTLVAVCLGTFMLLLDITIVNVALPDIQRALHSSFADLQWVVDAYALTLASFLLTAGSLADIYGRRVLYLIGLVVFTGASALCGFATSTLMLQLSRGLQGVGGAIMFAVSLALLANAFRGTDRGVAFGVWGAVTGLAVAIGPLIGGVLTSGLSWRWIFFRSRERSPGPPSPPAWTASCWSRRSSRSWQASYRWPLSAAGTSRAPRPAIRKVPGNEAPRTARHAGRIRPGRSQPVSTVCVPVETVGPWLPLWWPGPSRRDHEFA